MSLVHHKLYQSGDLSRIKLGEYLRELAELIRESYREVGNRVDVKTRVDEVSVLIDLALPCGLVITELITNSFTHAFPGDRRGSISIDLREKCGDLEITLSDDGVGLPDDFDPRKEGVIGLPIAIGLVETQLKGSISFDSRNGLACLIKFGQGRYTARI